MTPGRHFRFGLLTALTFAAIAVSVPAEAEAPAKLSRVGLLDVVAPNDSRRMLWESFRRRLRELGYREGEHVVFEFRSAHGRTEKLGAAAAELAALKVDVIVAASTPGVLAARRSAPSIPIVMTNTSDPVGTGLVASLAHPGGNVTGLTTLSNELSVKRLELLRELIPDLSRVGVLADATNPAAAIAVRDTQGAAGPLRMQILSFEVRSRADIDGAFTAAIKEQTQALIVFPGPLLFGEMKPLVALAARHGLPVMYAQREYVDAGGLAAYGASLSDNFARAAVFVDKILRGVKPADLPVEQPTRFEFVINLRAAKTLGLTVTPSLLLRADSVIR
ncbi:MAG TPA: ABC transporter substrate-binding protein [Burkholderiales bacterium]|nr:ABC transporter substrate-binding protein [Burkholderiales bacterium]